MTGHAKQKISANLDHHWSKKCSFLCVQTKWVCPSGIQRFCKTDSDSSLESLIVTRVESFCEKHKKCRVTIFLNVTRIESESPKIVTRVETLTRVTLSLWNTKKINITIRIVKGGLSPFIPPVCTFGQPYFRALVVSEPHVLYWKKQATYDIVGTFQRPDIYSVSSGNCVPLAPLVMLLATSTCTEGHSNRLKNRINAFRKLTASCNGGIQNF